jgi:hypothetical protein
LGCSVPISVHLSGAFIRIFDGSGSWIWAAFPAIAPYVIVRFDFACVMTLFLDTSSDTGTFHSVAAASSSRSRASAPANWR